MLGFFRHVYAEVVTALPINGGTYNALLNTTSKRRKRSSNETRTVLLLGA